MELLSSSKKVKPFVKLSGDMSTWTCRKSKERPPSLLAVSPSDGISLEFVRSEFLMRNYNSSTANWSVNVESILYFPL